MNIPVYVGKSDVLSGIRCIKAARDIKAGEIIESCPIILIPTKELVYHDKTVLTNYNYDWDDDNDAMVLGYCGLSNHSFSANVQYKRNFELKCMEYYAVKDIKKDEEIFVNYNGNPNDSTPLEYGYHTDFKL
ncbi:MAG: SET domain-containing protein-lysine N-methyltransferase [bacterium]